MAIYNFTKITGGAKIVSQDNAYYQTVSTQNLRLVATGGGAGTAFAILIGGTTVLELTPAEVGTIQGVSYTDEPVSTILDALTSTVFPKATNLTSAEIVASINVGGEIPSTGLLAEYRFDEGSGSTLTDYSGNDRNGTYVGSPTFIAGGGFTAGGTTSPAQYAIGHTDFLLTAQTFYFAVGIGTDSSTNYHPIMGNSSGLTNLNISLSDMTDNAQFFSAQVYGGSGPGSGGLAYSYDTIRKTPSILAVVIDGTNVAQTKIYIDGKEVASYKTQALNCSLGRVGTPWFGGTNNSATSGVSKASYFYAASYSTLHTAAEVAQTTATIRDILDRRGTATPDYYKPTTTTAQILATGSSTTFGTNSSAYLSLIQTRITFDKYVKGWPGATNELSFAADGFANLYFAPKASFNIVLIQYGGNVTTSRNLYRAVYESIQIAVKAFKQAGWKVLVQTVIDRGDATGLGVPGYFDAINGLIRSNFLREEIVDIAADPRFGVAGASNSLTYYNADKVHLNSTGQQILADMYSAKINRFTNYGNCQGPLYTQNANATVTAASETTIVGLSINGGGELNNLSIMGNTTNGSAVVATSQGSPFCVVGQLVTGSGIPANTTIISISFGVSITLSANATATASNVPLVVSKMGVKKHFFDIGQPIEINQNGLLSTGTSQTLNKKVKLGSTVLAATGAVTLPNSLSSSPYFFRVLITPISLGLTAAFRVEGELSVYNGTGFTVYPIVTSATVSVDTTVDALLDITDTFGNTGNTDVSTSLVISRKVTG